MMMTTTTTMMIWIGGVTGVSADSKVVEIAVPVAVCGSLLLIVIVSVTAVCCFRRRFVFQSRLCNQPKQTQWT